MIRLVIADDHAILRSGLKQLFALAGDLQVVAEAVDGGQVLQCLQRADFDLLLLDMNMPGVSGVDLIARVRAHQPQLPILVLSMHNEPQVAARALKAGANGYITKDCEPEVLLAAMRKVAAGGNFIPPALAEQMVFELSSSAPRAAHTLLSERELEVMLLLIQGLGVNEIAAKLSISGKTVSTHKLRLMEKMKISSLAELVRYAMENDIQG